MIRRGALLLLSATAVLLACQLDNLLSGPTPSTTPGSLRTQTATKTVPVALPATVEPPTPVPPPVMAMAKENLRVRAAPSTTAQIVDRLNKGDIVRIVGRTPTSDWWQIPLPANPNALGWISAQFTDVQGPASVIPIVEPGAPRPPQPPSYPPPQAPPLPPAPSPPRPGAYPYP